MLPVHSGCSLIKKLPNGATEKSRRKSLPLPPNPLRCLSPPTSLAAKLERLEHEPHARRDSLLKEPFTRERRKADWLQAPESGAGSRHAACMCWLRPRVGWVRCQWHSRADLSDESPFQFLPFMSNQMTRGWRDKLSDAPYPGGAWREALLLWVTPVQPCKHPCRAPTGCSPAATASITAAPPSCFKISHCSQQQPFLQAHSCLWCGAEKLFHSSQKDCVTEMLSLPSVWMDKKASRGYGTRTAKSTGTPCGLQIPSPSQ